MPLRRQLRGAGRLVLVAIVLLLCWLLFYSRPNYVFQKQSKGDRGRPRAGGGLSLKDEKTGPVNQYCEDRFGVNYLESFHNSRAQYCASSPKALKSQSRMTCLSNNVDPSKARTDSFCVAGPAMYDLDTQKFSLNCPPKTLTPDEIEGGVQPFDRCPAYWYQTGPKFIMDHHFNLNVGNPLGKESEGGGTLVLIKREDANFNMWHSLMEIMSAYWSLLVLSRTVDAQTGRPLYSSSAHTQILILDDIADGPYWDMWSLVAPDPPRRYLEPGPRGSRRFAVPVAKVIVPLPGGSNPFWQGDWADLNCTSSRLLNDFSEKALAHYKIKPSTQNNVPITITYVDRVAKRRLVDQGDYIAALRRSYPSVAVNVVDYASYTFKEQLKISAKTDILVGVHGAGLTHVMFMPQGSAMVELMPFNVDYHGFRNMARMRSIGYYQSKTEDKEEQTHAKGDWQDDDVWISQDAFLSTVGKAIGDFQTNRNRG